MMIKMKSYTLTLLLLLCSLLLPAQPNPGIAQIRKIVNQINADTVYIIKTLENEQFMEQMTDGGGQLTGNFKKGHLIKISEKVGLSSCVKNFEYYYQNNKLIFIYGQEQVFAYIDSSNSFDYSSKKIGWEGRYYLQNEKLVKSVEAGHSRCITAPKASQIADVLTDAKKYAALLKQ